MTGNSAFMCGFLFIFAVNMLKEVESQ